MAKSLSANTDLKISELYGGVGPKAQQKILEGGVDIIVGNTRPFRGAVLHELFSTKQLKNIGGGWNRSVDGHEL